MSLTDKTQSPSRDRSLVADRVGLRQAAASLIDRSTDDWRHLWSRVRTAYRASLTEHLDTIADRTGLASRTLAASLSALLDGLEPDTLPDSLSNGPQVTLVILAASVPALAAQPLVPLLASGSAVILRPSRREPDSARLLVEALEGVDRTAAAAVMLAPSLHLAGDGGTASGVDRVVAYGHDETVESIAGSLRHVDDPIFLSLQGHGWSAVYLAAESIDDETLDAVARDIALFDQRGCLCPKVVLTAAPAAEIVERMGLALARSAKELPPNPDTTTLAAMRGYRDTAVAAGLSVSAIDLAAGLVVERDTRLPLEEAAGGRSVWVYGERSIAEAVELLRPLRDRLTSLAVATPEASRRRAYSALASLQVSRIALPGEIHSPGFDWVVRQLRLG